MSSYHMKLMKPNACGNKILVFQAAKYVSHEYLKSIQSIIFSSNIDYHTQYKCGSVQVWLSTSVAFRISDLPVFLRLRKMQRWML